MNKYTEHGYFQTIIFGYTMCQLSYAVQLTITSKLIDTEPG